VGPRGAIKTQEGSRRGECVGVGGGGGGGGGGGWGGGGGGGGGGGVCGLWIAEWVGRKGKMAETLKGLWWLFVWLYCAASTHSRLVLCIQLCSWSMGPPGVVLVTACWG